MTDTRHDDEIRLIDFLRGELSPAGRKQVTDRLAQDADFKALHDDLANTFAAMDLAVELDPPAHLVEASMTHIARARRTDALLAREEIRRGRWRPTFSLRGLTGVAASFLIMALVLVPSMQQARRVAIQKQCMSHASQIGAGLLSYANTNDDYLPASTHQATRWLPNDGAETVSNSATLFTLVRLGYVSREAFQCPAGKASSFAISADMTDFPQGKHISYSYQHSVGGRRMRLSDPALGEVADRMVILADSSPIFAEGRFNKDKVHALTSENHGSRGQNVLYLDRHVEWVTHPTVGVSGDNIFLAGEITDYTGTEQPTSATDTFLLPAFSGSVNDLRHSR